MPNNENLLAGPVEEGRPDVADPIELIIRAPQVINTNMLEDGMVENVIVARDEEGRPDVAPNPNMLADGMVEDVIVARVEVAQIIPAPSVFQPKIPVPQLNGNIIH